MARPCTSKPTERCRPFTFHVNTKTERPPHRNINFPYLCFAILYKATIYTRRVHTYIVCVCVYVCVYIYIYIYIYTHTHKCVCVMCVYLINSTHLMVQTNFQVHKFENIKHIKPQSEVSYAVKVKLGQCPRRRKWPSEPLKRKDYIWGKIGGSTVENPLS